MDFLRERVDVLMFLHGTAVLLQLAVVFHFYRTDRRGVPWGWAVLYALAHLLYQWMTLFILVSELPPTFWIVANMVQGLSFVFLMEFGRRFMLFSGRHIPAWPVVFLPLCSLGFLHWGDISFHYSVNYLLRIPSLILIGMSLWGYRNRFVPQSKMLHWLAVAVWTYVLFNIVSPPAIAVESEASFHLAAIVILIAFAFSMEKHCTDLFASDFLSWRKQIVRQERIWIAGAILAMIGVLTTFEVLTRQNIHELKRQTIERAEAWASILPSEDLDILQGEQTSAFRFAHERILNLLRKMLNTQRDVEMAYLLRKRDDRIVLLTSLDSRKDEERSRIAPHLDYQRVFLEGTPVFELARHDTDGQWARVVVPVHETSNDIRMALGLTIPADIFLHSMARARLIPILAGMIGMIFLVTFWLLWKSGHEHVLLEAREREKDEQEKREIEKHLFHSEKLASIGTMAATMAHEINNPLTIVKGISEMIATHIETHYPQGDEARRLMEHHSKAVRRIDDIVRGLRIYVRSDVETQEVLSAHLVFNELISLIQPLYHKTDVRLVVQYNATNDQIVANRGKLQQVLMNLLSNARDAILSSRSAGTITIFTQSNSSHFTLMVKDDGPGIPEHIQKKIFDSFFTTKPSGKGTGLGLSIVRNMILSMGGSVSVLSVLGEGAEFKVVLPLNREDGDVS